MAWKLDIHLLDVGQGDCTLIVARDAAAGLRRTMLIDAGEAPYGRIAHQKVVDLGLPGVDHIVSTHYDVDHRAGLQSLLLADDLSKMIMTLNGPATVNAIGLHRPARIASVTAAVCSTALGNYGPNAFNATLAATAARGQSNAADTDAVAIATGYWGGDQYPAPVGVASLIPHAATRQRVARRAGLAAANAIAAGQGGAALRNTIAMEIFTTLRTGVPIHARFHTGNRYNATHVIDLGAGGVPTGWVNTIQGRFPISGNGVRVPNGARHRTSIPNRGREVLWNSGPNAMVAPANAPQVYVVTCNGLAWQGIGNAPFLITNNQNGGNDCSIGLVIRFNDFFYCTLGDLAKAGENAVMAALMAHGLPSPPNIHVPLPVPARFASLKCSHHGAKFSTSTPYLAAAQPRTALISVGFHLGFQHPTDKLLRRLQHEPAITRFYLTNCNFQSPYVPASMGLNQLTAVGNKSRVAGDNNHANLVPGRDRGDIRLRITEAQSQAAVGAGRAYRVEYWDEDAGPGFRTRTQPF